MTTPPPTRTPVGPTADADVLCGDLLRAGLTAAATTWGAFDLPAERFASEALARARRRLERVGVGATPARLLETLERTALADLAVAIACADGVPDAWEALVAGLEPRLRGLARSRGVAEADAGALAADVLAETSLPATRREPRRLIATYEGAGSLFGWTAVILVRRLRRARRGEAGGAGDAAALDRAPDVRLPDPAAAAAATEDATRLSRSLAPAWESLDGRERLAISCRFLDGLPQTRIAKILRVSEPHTSRILARALDRLRGALRAVLPEPSSTADDARLAEALRRHLVSAAAPAPLPFERER